MSVNYDDFWSDEARLRKTSRLTEIVTGFAGAHSSIPMHGGLPPAASFPITRLALSVQSDGDNSEMVMDDLKTLASAQQYNMRLTGNPGLHDWASSLTQQQHNPPQKVDVVITSGATNAVNIVSSLLLNRGDAILVEEFTWSLAFESIFSPRQYDIIPVRLDDQGLDPNHLQQVMEERKAAGAPAPRLLYTIPTAQNPTGITLSHERKAAIYKVCQQHNILIMEDDAYYWIHYPRGPANPPGLQLPASFLSMDTDSRVIRIDTTAKLLGPGYRLGWISAAPPLVAKVALGLNCTSVGPSSLSQVVVAEMMERWGSAGFLKFLKGVQRRYASLAAAAQAAAEEHLRGLATWVVPTAGMFMWLRLEGVEDAAALMGALVEGGVVVVPGSTFWVESLKQPDAPCPYIRVSFASASEEQLQEGFRRMSAVLRAQAG